MKIFLRTYKTNYEKKLKNKKKGETEHTIGD